MVEETRIGNWTDDECFYVTVTDAGRVARLLGPFKTHEAALESVETARREAEKVDPWSVFYAFGTSKWANGHRDGALNHRVSPYGWNGEAVTGEK